jgi:hypothetical protein
MAANSSRFFKDGLVADRWRARTGAAVGASKDLTACPS